MLRKRQKEKETIKYTSCHNVACVEDIRALVKMSENTELSTGD